VRWARAIWLLTVSLWQRLLREGFVVRSLAFPVALTAGTLVATLVVVAAVKPPRTVAVPPGVEAALETSLRDHGFLPVTDPDPPTSVEMRRVYAGTDGEHLWRSWPRPEDALLEAAIRKVRGAPWRPEAEVRMPGTGASERVGLLLVRMIGALFALYGVVFGVGTVARDRDDGTLSAEMSLPVPLWVHGAARWISGATLLGLFFALSAMIFAAIFGLPDTGAAVRHGIAAGAGSVAVGLVSVGSAGR
jgi:hypothetical protein